MLENSKMDTVLSRLLKYRHELKLSQEEFSKYIGSSQSNYSDVEHGNNIMTYHFLNGLYHYDCDIDFFFIGKRTVVKDNLQEKLLEVCNDDEAVHLYTLMVTGFVELWEGDEKQIWNRCLGSELKAMRLLLLQGGDLDARLYYVRMLHKMSQKELGNLMGVGRSKCSECEHGKKNIDADMLLRLYNGGLALPSFFFEKYAGIRSISYLLEENKELKRRYYRYLECVVSDVMGKNALMEIIKKSEVL